MKYRLKRQAVEQPSDPSYKLIPLTQGQNAIVDAADFAKLSKFNCRAQWNAKTKSFYAHASQRNIPMARVILGLAHGDPRQAEHKNHDTLDNRRENLRIATCTQNMYNRKRNRTNRCGYKGVRKEPSGNYFWRIRVCGVRLREGPFPDAETAARSYDEAAWLYHGEFAHLNFPSK